MRLGPPPIPHSRLNRAGGKWKWLVPALAVPCIVLGAGLWLLLSDEAPPDLSDFEAPARAIPPDDNAYLILRDAALALPPLPKTTAEGDALPSPRDILSGFAIAPAEQIDALLAPYEPLWPRLEDAANAPGSQAPALHRFTDTIPEAGNLRLVIELALLRALREAESGNISAAISRAEQALHLSRQIEASHNTLLQLLLGQASAAQSLACLRRLGDQATAPNDLISLSARLDRRRGEKESVAAAFRTEARVTARLLGSRRLLAEAAANITDKDDPPARASGYGLVLYRPHETQRVYANFMRESLGLLDEPWPVARLNSPKNKLTGYIEVPFPRRISNLQGRIMLDFVTTSPTAFIRNRLKSETWLDLTRLQLAARAHYIEHGRLPARLSELAPRYLPALPLDPSTGKPFHYHAEEAQIWSAGPILRDEDANEGPSAKDALVVTLAFARTREAPSEK